MADIFRANTERVDLNPFYRGDDWPIEIQMEGEDGQVMDLTDMEFTLTLKHSPSQPDADSLIQISSQLDGSETDRTAIVLWVSNELTSKLVPTVYYYDIQLVLNSKITTISSGRVRVLGDVTLGNV